MSIDHLKAQIATARDNIALLKDLQTDYQHRVIPSLYQQLDAIIAVPPQEKHNTIVRLPTELLVLIALFLPAAALKNLALVSKQFYAVTRQPAVRRTFSIRKWPAYADHALQPSTVHVSEKTENIPCLAVQQSTIYVACSGTVHVYNASLKCINTYTIPTTGINSMHAHNNILYIQFSNTTGIHTYNASTGSPLNSYATQSHIWTLAFDNHGHLQAAGANETIFYYGPDLTLSHAYGIGSWLFVSSDPSSNTVGVAVHQHIHLWTLDSHGDRTHTSSIFIGRDLCALDMSAGLDAVHVCTARDAHIMFLEQWSLNQHTQHGAPLKLPDTFMLFIVSHNSIWLIDSARNEVLMLKTDDPYTHLATVHVPGARLCYLATLGKKNLITLDSLNHIKIW